MPKERRATPRTSPYKSQHVGAGDGSTTSPMHGQSSSSSTRDAGSLDDKGILPSLIGNHPSTPIHAAERKKILPLHFFYETNSSFFRVHEDHITEMAATVEESTMTPTDPDFASIVFTPNPADPEDFGENLENKKNWFPLVLAKFLQWLTSKTEELSESNGVFYHPVLVAHKGFTFHYPMLISEIYRHNLMELVEGIFEKYNILFADSILHVHEVRDETGRLVNMSRGMKLDMLYKKHFPEEINLDINWHLKQVRNLGKPHKALERVEKLRRVYMETHLRESISGIPRHSYKEQLQQWETSVERRKLRVAYHLKCSETRKLLIELNISHATLMECYDMTEDSDIDRYLRHKGIASKALRMKLAAGIKEKN